jgi:predicted nucleotidyltransferase
MRKNRMKYISQKFLKGVVIFVAFLLLINQHAKGIIGDAGKPRPDLKQSLLQDVGKINEEIKIAKAKLNKANEGDDLFKLTLTRNSIPNLKNQMNELSQKIAEALKNQLNNKELMILSNDVKQAMSILNSLEQKAKANMKSASLELLKRLSAVVLVIQNDINKLGPQPEPPD